MAQFLFYHTVLVGVVASPCQSDLTLPNALAPTFLLVGAFLFKIENLVLRARFSIAQSIAMAHGEMISNCEFQMWDVRYVMWDVRRYSA